MVELADAERGLSGMARMTGYPAAIITAMIARGEVVGAGAEPLSSPQPRSWGDVAGYCRCPDGHLLAFAAPAP